MEITVQTQLDENFYDFMSVVIAQGEVHAVNQSEYSQYQVVFTDGEVFRMAVLTSRYFGTTGKDIVIQYDIVMDNIVVAVELNKLPPRPSNKPDNKLSIENLMRQCSKRIIAMELKKQKNFMFNSMLGHNTNNKH